MFLLSKLELKSKIGEIGKAPPVFTFLVIHQKVLG